MFEVATRKSLKQGIIKGKKEGIIEGKKEGLAEGAKKIAHQMIMEGESLNKVSKYTGLSLDELKGLKRKS